MYPHYDDEGRSIETEEELINIIISQFEHYPTSITNDKDDEFVARIKLVELVRVPPYVDEANKLIMCPWCGNEEGMGEEFSWETIHSVRVTITCKCGKLHYRTFEGGIVTV